MTDHLASYVREKVKSGRYNNASELVRDAIRRMEEDEARETQLAQPRNCCWPTWRGSSANPSGGWFENVWNRPDPLSNTSAATGSAS